MRVLLTGASGLIGRAVLAAAPQGWELFAPARTPGPEAVRWIACDLTAPGLAAALPDRIDAVLHLAQARRYRDFPGCAPEVTAVNVCATATLLHHAVQAGARRFVLASTATIYEPSHELLSEDSPIRVRSVYGASKRAAELLVEPYRDLLDCRVLRIFTAFGAVRDDRLVSDLIDRVQTGRAVDVAGEHGLIVSPLHADHAAEAVVAATLAPQVAGAVDVVNVGGPPLGIREMAEAIGRAAGVQPLITAHPGPEPGGYGADRSKAQRVLGLGQAPDFEAGVRRVLRDANIAT